MPRKKIAVVSDENESIYQNRVITGINAEAKRLDCEILVFTTFIKTIDTGDTPTRQGEINIYNLINYDDLDGIIVLYLPLEQDDLLDTVIPKIKEKAKCPVVCVDNGNLSETFYAEQVFAPDDLSMELLTNHVIEKHGCKDIYCITGPEGDRGAELRRSGYERAMKNHGLPTDGKVFYGEYWFPNGERVADRIISGELHVPEAICCCADHIAAGAANRLNDNGIKVPDDVIVTGFDGSKTAIYNEICITSILPALEKLGAEALVKLWEHICGERPENVFADKNGEIKLGQSCGCECDLDYINTFRDKTGYLYEHNYSKKLRTDMSILTNSLMEEKLTGSKNFEECYRNIADETYLINDYRFFILSLCEGWNSINGYEGDSYLTEGYTDSITMVLHSTSRDFIEEHPELTTKEGGCIYDVYDRSEVSLTELVPDLDGRYDEPLAWYFVPVHFRDRCFGYGVLVCDLTMRPFDHIFRCWIKNVNNALEMQRIRNILMHNSMRDSLTGLFNRRGLDDFIEKHSSASKGKKIFYLVADMDRLKYVNDNFGHSAGDEGIQTVASAALSCTEYNEICVRTGGDEFAVVGFGDYDDKIIYDHEKVFRDYLEKANNMSKKPYKVSSSVGVCVLPYREPADIEKAAEIADKIMYKRKKDAKLCRN